MIWITQKKAMKSLMLGLFSLVALLTTLFLGSYLNVMDWFMCAGAYGCGHDHWIRFPLYMISCFVFVGAPVVGMVCGFMNYLDYRLEQTIRREQSDEES